MAPSMTREVLSTFWAFSDFVFDEVSSREASGVRFLLLLLLRFAVEREREREPELDEE